MISLIQHFEADFLNNPENFHPCNHFHADNRVHNFGYCQTLLFGAHFYLALLAVKTEIAYI